MPLTNRNFKKQENKHLPETLHAIFVYLWKQKIFKKICIGICMKNIIFIIIALVTTTSLQAQHLWKISNGGLKKPSYIFATHPYVSSNFLDSKSDVFKYFNQTTKVLGEFDSKDFEGIKVIQQNAFLDGKKSLKFFMSEEDFRFADTFLSENAGFTLESVALLKPQFVLELYYEQLARTLAENKDGIFLDAWFQWYASEKGKSVGGLESLGEYLKYSNDTTSITEQVDKMLNVMKKNDAFKQLFSTEIDEYKTGNVQALSQKSNALYERNKQRAAVIDNEIRKTTCFITINAATLTGEHGLLKVLESNGFTVTAVELKK